MATKRTIAELAQVKAELLEELSAVNAEIASRAGETDDDEADNPPVVETATDKTVENVETATNPSA